MEVSQSQQKSHHGWLAELALPKQKKGKRGYRNRVKQKPKISGFIPSDVRMEELTDV